MSRGWFSAFLWGVCVALVPLAPDYAHGADTVRQIDDAPPRISETIQSAKTARNIYLEVLRPPPIRHVIAMNDMKGCLRAAEYSSARCISKLPQLSDSETGVLRTPGWSAKPFYYEAAPKLEGKDFWPVYLAVYRAPPNRHVIAMPSMKKCLEAIAFTSAECIEKLPDLPDSSVGVLQTFNTKFTQ